MIDFILYGLFAVSFALNVYFVVNRKKGTVDSLLKEIESKAKDKLNYDELKEDLDKLKSKIK